MPVIVGNGSTGFEGRSDRAKLPTGTTDPVTASAGDTYYNTDTSKIRIYNGTDWNDLTTSGGGGGGTTGYVIENSLRFNSSESSYLSRNFSTGGNRKTWTWAAWVKRSGIGSGDQMLFSSGTTGATTSGTIFFRNDLLVFSTLAADVLATTAVFRDPSAWYHIVVSFDSTQATVSSRLKFYVNGLEITQFSTDNRAAQISQNTDYGINLNQGHEIGRFTADSSRYFNGMLAEIYFIDGQALLPTAFGEFDVTTGVWNPIQYTGTYGTTGFKLPLSNASALGTDSSGNNNTWTANNFRSSVTGSIYSSRLTGSATGSPSGVQTPHYAFYYGSPSIPNVSQQTGSRAYVNHNGGTSWIQFTPTTAITGSNLRIFTYQPQGTSGADTWININGGSDLRPWGITANYNGWSNSVAIPGGSLTSIRVSLSYSAASTIAIWAIEIDGVILKETLGYESNSLKDSPTNGTASSGADPGGSIVGNYATLNPLHSQGATFSEGNLRFLTSSIGKIFATIGVSSGKWYWESQNLSSNSLSSLVNGVGLITGNTSTYGGGDPGDYAWLTRSNTGSPSSAYNNGVLTGYGNIAVPEAAIIGTAFDADTGKLEFFVNGVSQGVAWSNIPVGSQYVYAPITGDPNSSTDTDGRVNFGQQPFIYPAPAGYKSLNTANLPTATILDSRTAMDVKLYTGNGGTQSVGGFLFSPDLVWLKARNNSFVNGLFDTVRGVSRFLVSNNTNAELLNEIDGYLSAFNSNGFTLSAGSNSSNTFNSVNGTQVAWCWDAGESTVTNNNGSRTSQVRANPTTGFSVATWSGSGSGSVTVGHGLNNTPQFFIVKDRSNARNWLVYHRGIGPTGGIQLNVRTQAAVDINYWNNTAPTSTVATIGVYGNESANYVGYFWAPVEGFSSFGSYTGNASASDGPFIYTGFKVKWILFKNTASSAEDWWLHDTARNSYNVMTSLLLPNSSGAESTSTAHSVDALSNGFKIRTTAAGVNGTNTIIYAAFAENPFSIARAR